MLGNCTYRNATKIHLGKYSIEKLGKELAKYGKSGMLVYGGGSIKTNGIYEQVMSVLKANVKRLWKTAE